MNCESCKILKIFKQDCLICEKVNKLCEKCHYKDVLDIISYFFTLEDNLYLLNNSINGKWLEVIIQDKKLFCVDCLKFGLYVNPKIDDKNSKFVRINYLLKLKNQFKFQKRINK